MGGWELNLIPNGNLELWDAGPVPREMDAAVVNTVITILNETDPMDALARYAWADASPPAKHVYEGQHALRATLAAAAAADNFRLYPEGLVAATWAGASTEQITIDGLYHRYRLSFAARCSVDGNILLGRIVLRDATDTVRLHKDCQVNGGGVSFPDRCLENLWMAADGATRPTWQLTTVWRRYGVTFVVPPADATVPIVLENMVWQLSNGSAGAQIIDIDDVQIIDLEQSFAGR